MTLRVSLAIDQPLDLDASLDSGQSFRWRRDDAEPGAWLGVLEGRVVRLRRTRSGVEAEVEPEAGLSAEEIATRLTAYFRLDDDLPAIQRALAADPHVTAGIVVFPGLRILRQDPWEILAGFILSSTSNIPRIARTMELLASSLGEEARLGGVRRHAFPSPEAVAEAGEGRLRELRCGFRAAYLAAAADAVAAGRLPLHELRGAPYAEAAAALTALPGIGPKIADCVMLFSLDRAEAFPVDLWVRRALVDHYGLDPKLSYDSVREWAWERFGANAGYANQYLFWHIRQTRRPMIAAGLTQPLEP
ncbi:MAG: 8-oxoguanine DNA glycosylase [Dehalococcoidia bacterium]|nr:8-oxoguanine DNA glycosylase [Dehalococcoidia bacterium]